MMPRPLRFSEHMVARFPKGTFDQIEAILGEGEDRAEFVRRAVSRMIQERESRGNSNALTPQSERLPRTPHPIGTGAASPAMAAPIAANRKRQPERSDVGKDLHEKPVAASPTEQPRNAMGVRYVPLAREHLSAMTVRLPASLHDRLRLVAVGQRRPMQDIIADAVAYAVERIERGLPIEEEEEEEQAPLPAKRAT